MSLKTNFEKMLGRTPSDAEIQALYRTRDALELKDNDALWLVLMALQHHQTLYSKIPAQMQEEARKVLSQVSDASKAVIDKHIQETHLRLAEAVKQSSEKIAADTARREKFKWLAIATGVICASTILVSWYSYSRGHNSGYTEGYSVALKETADHKAAASWANTPDGRKAQTLWQGGVLSSILNCSFPGWKIENSKESGRKVCFPYSAGNPKDQQAWYIP